MVEATLIGPYHKEQDFINELNKFISKFDYNNLDIQYRMVINEIELLHSALVIIKDCR